MEPEGKIEQNMKYDPGERSEELVRILADAIEISSIGFAIREPDGRYGRTNAAFLSLVGYQKDEFLAMNAVDITPLEWQSMDERILGEIIRTGQPKMYEKEYIKKDGSRVPVELFVHPAFDDEGNFEFFYAFVSDITERKRSERKLEESEERFRTLSDASSAGIFVSLDGIIVDVNRAGIEMTGYERDEIIGRSVLDFFTSESKEVVKKMVSLGLTEPYEANMVKKDGSIMIAQIRGRNTTFKGQPARIATVQDITERKLAEEQLQTAYGQLTATNKELLSQCEEQANAEKAVRAREQQLNEITTNIPGVVYQFYARPKEDFGLFYVNERSSEIFGIDNNPSDFFFRFTDRVHPDDRDAFMESIRNAVSHITKWDFEGRFIKPSGEIIWFRGASSPVTHGNELVFSGVLMDITYQKEAERSLRESEERYRSLAENAFDGIIVTSGGIIVDVNITELEMTGYKRDEIIGRSVLDFFTSESKEVVKKMVSLGLTEPYEANMVKKDGSIMIAQIRGRNTTFKGQPARIATVQDITKRVMDKKRIEELAARSDAERLRLKTILDTLPVGIAITDSTGRIVEVNKITEQIWGVSAIDLELSDYCNYKGWRSGTGKQLKGEDWTLVRAFRGETIINEELDIERADGRRRTIIASGAPIKNASGDITGAVTIIIDITERKALEKDLAEAKTRAEMYLDLLTHDITNYNTAAMGYLQLAEMRLKLEEKEKKYITRPLQVLGNSSELIANVRDLQRVEAGREKAVLIDICQMLEEVKEAYENPPGREVTIALNAPNHCSVMASGLLRDAFSNIIGNAIKHSSGPLSINMSLSRESQNGTAYVRIEVEDNGPGIPDERKEIIFDRTIMGLTKSVSRSLGLYLVKRLMEEYNGSVWVEDRVPGDHTKGAKFVVMLPVT